MDSQLFWYFIFLHRRYIHTGDWKNSPQRIITWCWATGSSFQREHVAVLICAAHPSLSSIPRVILQTHYCFFAIFQLQGQESRHAEEGEPGILWGKVTWSGIWVTAWLCPGHLCDLATHSALLWHSFICASI